MTLLPEKTVRMDKQRTDVAKFEPSVISCWKKDNAGGDTSFKGYVEKFMNTSMDEHIQCFKNSMKKIVEKTKIVSPKPELESSSATQTIESK